MPHECKCASKKQRPRPTGDAWDGIKRRIILKNLRNCQDVQKAAAQIGLSFCTVYRTIKRLGIEDREWKDDPSVDLGE